MAKKRTSTKRIKAPSAKIREVEVLVPDTSVVAEGLLSKYLSEGKIHPKKIIIHHAVLNELENQANQGRESGFVGLKEIKKLRAECVGQCEVTYGGLKPGSFEIRHAKSGAVDDMIRDLAHETGALLLTADRVQALTAEAMGVEVELIRFIFHPHDHPHGEDIDPLEKYFTDDTMSLHIKEGAKTMTKRGRPGAWKFVEIDFSPDADGVRALADNVVEAAHARKDGFVEIERKGSTIVQLGRYRIVITKPPFSSAWEITAVRPVAHLHLKDYKFPEAFTKRLEKSAEGILVAGSPGEGKSTFAQALGEFYAAHDKIVKTIESPRDLVLPTIITQYSATHGTHEELRDVILLNRPDYTIFDEIRNTQDFLLFADMRLSGVGMIGVVHATSPVDSIQRFIGRVELGMVPQIIDTVVFIKGGEVAKMYKLEMTVKVPAGMTEADLARPVVVIKDFSTGEPEYEIYTYGDQTTVVPVTGQGGHEDNPSLRLAAQSVEDYFQHYTHQVRVEMLSPTKARVYVPEADMAKIIGKGGGTIQQIESELGLKIDMEADNNATPAKMAGGNIHWEAFVGKRHVTIELPNDLANTEIDLHDRRGLITQVISSKKGQIKVSLNSPIGKRIHRALDRDELEVHA